MSLPLVSPAEARRMLDAGAILVDIRGHDEHARARIDGARLQPLETLRAIDGREPVIFHCKSGMRTSANAGRLAAAAGRDAYILDGGLDAWARAGLPVIRDTRQPIEIMRQVQITAGSLVIVGVVMSQLVAPAWLGLSAFVGAGLVFAGTSGWCGMAKLLAVMPWNRRAGQQ